MIQTLKIYFALALIAWPVVCDAGISNTQNYLFAADRHLPFIDIIDLSTHKQAHRLKTTFLADDILVSPYAPILIYFNTEKMAMVFFDLQENQELAVLKTPMAPQHVVLDTTGSKIAVTNSDSGGFLLISVYTQEILFSLPDFPPTGNVLFDPNEVDIYFANNATGSLGLLDINLQTTVEMKVAEGASAQFSSPSRSLDSRYVYIADLATGEVYGLNAYSKVIYKTFNIGAAPARPYTTPGGAFLYLMDRVSGQFASISQGRFETYDDRKFPGGVDTVVVSRFDRFNVFLSSSDRHYYGYDNLKRTASGSGEFRGTPLGALGSADGDTAYVAFADVPLIAAVDLESLAVEYIPATTSGARSFTIGLSNNVCH